MRELGEGQSRRCSCGASWRWMSRSESTGDVQMEVAEPGSVHTFAVSRMALSSRREELPDGPHKGRIDAKVNALVAGMKTGPNGPAKWVDGPPVVAEDVDE